MISRHYGVPGQRSVSRPWCFITIIVFACAVQMPGAADETCASCGASPVDDATAAWLAEQGLGLDAFRIVLAWDETAPDTGEMVNGFRLAPLDGGTPLDIYRGQDGRLLDSAEMTQLGLLPKEWAAGPMMWPAELTPGLSEPKNAVVLSTSVVDVSPARFVSLVAPDLDAIAAEDQAARSGPSKGPLRFGIVRDLPEPVSLSGGAKAAVWTASVDGTLVWSAAFASPGAKGIRLHLAELALPAGGEAYVYDASDPAEVYGPMADAADFWTPTCFSEEAVLLCVLPAGADTTVAQVAVDQLAHLYKGLDELAWGKSAGSCNLDVACYSDWSVVALGVGGIGTVGKNGVLWCTGSLVVDGDPTTNIPYFITANHCISTSTAANNIEVYWLYQRPGCGGTTPDPKSVPRTTGGANFLVGSPERTGTDITLLRLRSDPPSGLVALGLTNESPAVGTPVTVIHHPSGDYKRISFGTITDQGSPNHGGERIEPIERFHEIAWNNGTTEPGSSGSPLFVTETQLFIGQLFGGYAACSLPLEPDYFGRFDVSYPLVIGWLGGALNAYDVNASGEVNAADLQAVINVIVGAQTLEAADVDNSGVVDAVDLQLVVNAIFNG